MLDTPSALSCLETEQKDNRIISVENRVARYVNCLKVYHRLVLIAWVLASSFLGVFGAAPLLSMTRNEFDPPLGSESDVAKKLINDKFPGINSRGTDIFYFEVPSGHSMFNGTLLQDFTAVVNDALREHVAEDMHVHLSIAGYGSSVTRGLPPAAARAQFVSTDNTSSFLVIQYPSSFTLKYGKSLYNVLLHLRSQYQSDKLSFIGGGGNALQTMEANAEGSRSIACMDLVSVPLAFVIFALSLRSIRFLLLPFLTLVVGYTTAFGTLGFLARAGLSVSSATPPLMMSMLLAVSIDYALFLLSRFKEELDAGSTMDTAVTRMLLHSGHTVCGSGFTLAFCFLALLFFPMHMMQSIGVGVIVSILSAILVNLTIVPAVLLACPTFFSKSSEVDFLCYRCRKSISNSSRTVSPLNDESDRNQPSRAFEATAWYRWSLFATSGGALVLTVVILCLLGCLSIVRCFSMHHSMDTWLFAPRASISSETFQRFSRSFSVGRTGPFQLLLLPNSDSSSTCSSSLASKGFYSEAFWSDATALLKGLVAEVYNSETKVVDSTKALGELHSIMYIYNVIGAGFQSSSLVSGGQQSSFSMPMRFALFLDPQAPDDTGSLELCHSRKVFWSGLRSACHKFLATKRCEDLVPLAPIVSRLLRIPSAAVPGACTAFQSLLNSSATSKRDAVYAMLIPAVLERSRESVEWTRKCREFLLVNAGKYPCVQAHLNGLTPQMVDAIDAIYSRVPTILGITMIICLVLVSSLTFSLAFGISAVGLISWTLFLVFASGDIVYRGNALEGLIGLGFVAGTGGLAWLVPPLTFSMIFGLGLDYNIFLLGRVCEYHCAGFSDREALAYGVAKTGPVISSAGLIMAVAFSGMMLSSIPMMNQVSLLLVAAVMIDTFFVRPLATPALHAPLKAWNWWPRGACS